jgi:hypothetical protein
MVSLAAAASNTPRAVLSHAFRHVFDDDMGFVARRARRVVSTDAAISAVKVPDKGQKTCFAGWPVAVS